MYTISYYSLQEIEEIKENWLRLEKGSEMTYFQRYDWYNMIAKLNQGTKHRHFYIILSVAKRDDHTVLIAPLWIVTKDFGKYNHKGIYFFGRAQWSDYLNFIYDKFDANALEQLMVSVSNKYGVPNYILEDIPINTSSFQYLNNKYTHLTEKGNTCVELFIPNNLEEYHKMLSKNARQNIRTAQNRSIKDGIEFKYNFDDKDVDISAFTKYRDLRLVDKVRECGTSLKSRLIYFISTKILGRGKYKFVPYTPFENDHSSHFLTCKDQAGNLCAAFCYGIDRIHNQIVLMAVSTNPDYYKYSPGILTIYNFVIEQMNKDNGFAKIDFTRGKEKYKYVLGGVEHYNQLLEFSI